MKRLLFLSCILVFSFFTAYSQIEVKGIVKDDSGNPLPGANVIISGTTTGTITNLEGGFTLNVPSGESKLDVSFVGLQTQTVLVGNRTFIEIQLQTSATELEAVVVLGYGVVKKSNVIGAISSVKSDDIKDRPVADLSQALQGKTSGVFITNNSGAPGEGTSLRIRGTGTINNSEPLYVIDGIMSTGMDHISITDIESIEILKDAASAAIYGAKGANGVVIVNTKQGKEGKLNINVDYYSGFQTFNNNIEVMDRYDYSIMNKIAKGNITDPGGAFELIDEGRESFFERNPDVNWIDEISQTGKVNRVSMSMSQGNEKISYYTSVGLYDNEGMIIGSGFKRTNASVKLNFKPYKKLEFGVKAAYSGTQRDKQNEGANSIFRQALIAPPDDIYDKYDGFLTDNPIKKASLQYDKTNGHRTDISANMRIKDIIEGLYFESRVGFDYYTGEDHIYEYEEPRYEYEFYTINDYKKPGVTQKLSQNQNLSWENILNYSRKFDQHDLGVMFIHSLQEYNSVNVKAEGESFLYNNLNFAYSDMANYKLETSGSPSENRSMGFAGRINYGFDDRYLTEFNFRYDGSSIFPKESRWGFFPSIQMGWRLSQEDFFQQYEWISQLKLRASAGQSGNNRINTSKQYSIYNNNNWYTWGPEGTTLQIDGYAPKSIGNLDILWEKTTTYNVGLDFGFFRTIYGSVEYFEKYTSDMLIEVPILESAGIPDNPMQNAGEVLNKGYEFELRFRKNIRDFSIEANTNLTYLKNTITKLGNGGAPIYGGDINKPDLGYVTYTSENRSIGEFYGYIYDENDVFYRTKDDVRNSSILNPGGDFIAENGEGQYVGTFKYKDINGDGKLNEEDKVYLGSPHPDFYGGFGLNMSYKNFSLNMFWQYQYGNEIFNVLKFWLDAGATNKTDNGEGKNEDISNKRNENIGNFIFTSADESVPYYNPESNNSTAILPTLSNNEGVISMFQNQPSNFFIEDGSYMRLKDITLSYNIPKDWLRRARLSSMRVYVGANNLLTFTNYSGFDPEIGTVESEGEANINMGIDYGTYPQPRTIYFGINIGL